MFCYLPEVASFHLARALLLYEYLPGYFIKRVSEALKYEYRGTFCWGRQPFTEYSLIESSSSRAIPAR